MKNDRYGEEKAAKICWKIVNLTTLNPLAFSFRFLEVLLTLLCDKKFLLQELKKYC